MKIVWSKNARRPFLFPRGLAAAAVVLLAGCAAGNWGALRQDAAVTRTFEAFEVLPDHRYYLSGTESLPDGLLAVETRYRLRSDLWREIEATPELLRRLVANMRWGGMYLTEIPVGAIVLGPGGERVGLWYSDIGFSFVKVHGNGEVRVQTPANLRAIRRDLQRSRDKSSD